MLLAARCTMEIASGQFELSTREKEKLINHLHHSAQAIFNILKNARENFILNTLIFSEKCQDFYEK